MSTSGGHGGGAVSVATAHVTAAQINTLNSVPVELIPAPGAGIVIDIIDVTMESVPGSPGNWLAFGGLELFYGTSASEPQRATFALSQLDMLSAQAIPTSPQAALQPTLLGLIAVTANVANQAVTIGCPMSDPQKVGGIATFSVNNGGALYAIGDTGTVDPDNYGGNAAYTVDTVDGGGAVLTMHLTAAGTGYGAGDTARATTPGGSQPGIGSGLTIDVLTVPQPAGNLYVSASYRFVTTH